MGRASGCANTRGAVSFVHPYLNSFAPKNNDIDSILYYNDSNKPESGEDARMLATVYLDGKKLKRIRTLQGKTQRALSKESGVSTSTIWLLETREKNERFHPPTLTKLARGLGVEPTELVSGD